MNIVLQHKEELSESNYILHPEHARAYWANISGGRLNEYLRRCREAFNIVIVGNTADDGDFYAIPYRVLKSASVSEYRTADKTGRVRWAAYILHHQIKVGTAPSIDVGGFYGNDAALTNPGEVDPASAADLNDYAIENRKIEIEQRQKQSLFRKRVMDNFTRRCCICDIEEGELLVASHIIPWATRIDSRLDPANGLLFYSPYDRLFDQGFISFDEKLRVVVTPRTTSFSKPLRMILAELSGKQARHPVKWPIKPEYLAYHRDNVLRKGRQIHKTVIEEQTLVE
jgi:putative restriction endonuclease